MDVVRSPPVTTGFLISKGGITSNDVLSDGLALRTSRVVGQILAGCSVVCCPDNHSGYSDMPVVIFPGNVGDDFALATVYLPPGTKCWQYDRHHGESCSG